MIIILAPTAQLASDTLEFSPPPALTIGSEYGAFVLEGSEYTSANKQLAGSPYIGRHISPFGKPASCNDTMIPKLQDSEVVLVGKIDINILGGLMRATDKFVEKGSFWFYVEHIDSYGIHKAIKDHPSLVLYNGILSWVEANSPKIDEKRNNDITEFCYEAFGFITEALEDGVVATEMGLTRITLQEKLDESSFVAQEPSGIIIRRGEGVNHLYRDGIAVISYDDAKKNITISTSDPIKNFSCFRLVQEWWGDRAKGNDQIAMSDKSQFMTESDFLQALEMFEKALVKARI